MSKKTGSHLNSRKTFRANLPIPLTSFIGRERELAEVTDLLAHSHLLTLIGAGGCGKTRLALQLAKDTADAFPDGVWAVELAPLSDPALLPQSVALALGVQEAPRQSLTETLSSYLRLKHLLLVLDNCEHLRTAVAHFTQTLLLAAPNLKILATSREALSLAGETTYLVPSLSIPTPSDQSSAGMDSPAELQRYDAPTLFIERAKAVSSTFSVTPQNATAIVRVCQRLDGVPLAIELAAARARVLTVEQIAARLDDRFNLLTSDNPTVVISRHQTLRAAIDWSYELLSGREQKLFRRLSVFAGGFTIEAAEVICSDKELPPQQVLDVITELVDKSMLVADTAGRAETRYRLLETMREYAHEKLIASAQLDETHDRHLDYFVQFAEEAEPQLRGAQQLAWLNRVENEHDNLRAALQWSLESGQRESALRLAGAAFWFWNIRGYWSEGQKWLEDTLGLDERERSRRVEAAGGEYTPSRTELAQRAKALYGAGLMRYIGVTDLGAARRRMEESLHLWRALEDKWWIAMVLKDLGMISVMEGDIPTARAQFDAGVALAREVEDQWAIAVCLTRVGTALIRVDFPAARPIVEEAVAVSRAVGDKSVLWYALLNLAVVFALQRDYHAAVAIAEEALPLALEIGNRRDILLSPYIIGMISLLQGDEIKAAAHSAEALALAREADYPLGIPLAILLYGGLAARAGQPKRAVRLLAAAESIIRGLGISMFVWGDLEVVAYNDYMQIARTQLDEATFNAAFTAGGALTTEQAIEEAQSVAAQVQTKTDSPVSKIEFTPQADLTISAFGPAQIYRGEGLLTSADWTYAKSRELIFYLLSYDFRTKEEIGLDLWPDASPAQLRNALAVRLHHLRRALGRADWIVFENNTYAFNRSLNYWFDVEEFEKFIADAQRVRGHSPEQAIQHFQDAVKLYRGDFLQDWVEGEWFVTRRAELRENYLEALLTLGGLLFAESNYAQAAAAYNQVIEHDNYVEAAHRELMRCYARLGEQSQALRHYQELVELLRAELGSPPAPETTALVERLRRGEEI